MLAWFCASVHASRMLLTQYLANYWYIFTRLSALMHYGTRINVSSFRIKRLGYGGVLCAEKCTFWPWYCNNVLKIMDRISPNLQHWCILGQGEKLSFLGSKCQRSRSQHDQGPSIYRACAVCRVLISVLIDCWCRNWTVKKTKILIAMNAPSLRTLCADQFVPRMLGLGLGLKASWTWNPWPWPCSLTSWPCNLRPLS